MTEQRPTDTDDTEDVEKLVFTFIVSRDMKGIDADGTRLLFYLIMAMLSNGASIYELQQRLMGFQ